MTLNSHTATRLKFGQLGAPRRVMARKGKSFHWATFLFDQKTAADVALLYAFCRYVDDIADKETPEVALDRLSMVRWDLEAGFSRLPEVDAFIDLSRRIALEPEIPSLFVDAILEDTGRIRLSSWEELVRYAYGVASTVGLMMCAVMGVRDPAAYPFAVDLGIAMQLTNIARDVIEDAGRDRRYLPSDWLGEDLPPSGLLTGEPWMRKRVTRARRTLVEQADIYYRSADLGMRFIPFRGRLAVLTAARIYEAIGVRLLSHTLSWDERAYVSVAGKVRKTLGAMIALASNRDLWPFGRHPVHDPSLHRALSGLPGTNGGG